MFFIKLERADEASKFSTTATEHFLDPQSFSSCHSGMLHKSISFRVAFVRYLSLFLIFLLGEQNSRGQTRGCSERSTILYISCQEGWQTHALSSPRAILLFPLMSRSRPCPQMSQISVGTPTRTASYHFWYWQLRIHWEYDLHCIDLRLCFLPTKL